MPHRQVPGTACVAVPRGCSPARQASASMGCAGGNEEGPGSPAAWAQAAREPSAQECKQLSLQKGEERTASLTRVFQEINTKSSVRRVPRDSGTRVSF